MKERIGVRVRLVVASIAVAVLAAGCAGAVVGTMSAREQRVTCTDGGRRHDGSPYPARIRVPACLSAANDAPNEAERQRFRAQACAVSYAELSHPPDGMTGDDCTRAKDAVANAAGARERTQPRPDNAHTCYTKLEAKQDGDRISVVLRCGDSTTAIAGAKIQLNSSLTESAVDRDKPPDPEVGLTGNLKAITDDKGQATFDLSSVHAGARFSPTGDNRARIQFDGEFESGPRNEHRGFALVDLRNCSSYATWLAQSETERGGGVEGARKLTKQLADSGQAEKYDQVSAIANQYCGNMVQIRMEHAPPGQSGGDGEVCFNVGVYVSKTSKSAWDRQQRSASYFETSCKLGFTAACSRPEIAAAKTAQENLERRVEADRQRGAQRACAEAEQCHQRCARVQACIGRCPLPYNQACGNQCSRSDPGCSLQRCFQLDGECSRAGGQ